MTISDQTNDLLKAFGADPTTLRQFIDAHLKPEAKYHAQVLRFTAAVDSVFEAQNSLNDWQTGHVELKRAQASPMYEQKKAEVSDKREEFVYALKGILEAFWEDSHG